jgi:hypothetical protein
MPQLKAVKTIVRAKKPGQRKTAEGPARPPETETIEKGQTFDASGEEREQLLADGFAVEGEDTPVSQPSQVIHTTGFDPQNTKDPEGAEATAFSTPDRLDSDEQKPGQKKGTRKPKPGDEDDGSDLV